MSWCLEVMVPNPKRPRIKVTVFKFKIMSVYLGSGDGCLSAHDNNLFQLHLRCSAQILRGYI